jgi:2-polyprenyl-3-methyl-5-hydroxy-6-metoxy-1,4-benzoquinol methylase
MTVQNLAMNNSPTAEIRSRPCPNCPLCDVAGSPLYDGLRDRLFGAPGEWNLKRCPNSKCGLLWLDPMPLEEDIGKAYENYFTHAAAEGTQSSAPRGAPQRLAELFRSSYRAWRFNYGDDAGKPFRWLFALPIMLSRIECDGLDIPLRYLAVPNRGRMLDVGCGDGSVLKLANELGWNTEGVDFDPAAVANATRHGLSVRLGALKDQRYPENAFDLVLMSHVIEHVPDPLATIREIRRVLRPSGMLVATTPNAASLGHRHFGADWVALDPPRHLHIFTANGLAALANCAGVTRSIVSSTLRITPFDFTQSRLIHSFGHADMMRSPERSEVRNARAWTFAEMLMRVWDPLVADELLLEARK